MQGTSNGGWVEVEGWGPLSHQLLSECVPGGRGNCTQMGSLLLGTPPPLESLGWVGWQGTLPGMGGGSLGSEMEPGRGL